jgi:hypothetical protein
MLFDDIDDRQYPRSQQQGHRRRESRINSYCNRFSVPKPVTVASANLGACDKNPGMADTTMDKGAIFGKKEAAQRGSIRGATEQKAVGEASGRSRGSIQNI